MISALIAAPIGAYLQEGATSAGTVALREALGPTSSNLLQAVTLQTLISDPVDKALSFLVVYGILRLLPEAIRQRAAEAHSFSRSRRLSARYGVATLLSLVALLCAWVFLPAFGNDVFAMFYLAVVLSAWYGGLGPGLLAGGVGVLANIVLQSPPFGRGLEVEDWLRIIIFVAVSFVVAVITDRLDRTNAKLGGALAETRAVVNGVVEALVLVSPDERRVMSVNHQFESLFSVSTQQVLGRTSTNCKR